MLSLTQKLGKRGRFAKVSQLLLGQWRSWIIAMNGDDYDHKRRVKRVSVNSASRSPAIQFITLTTGKDGTKVYIDGQIIRAKK
jgi:hypothetical protein